MGVGPDLGTRRTVFAFGKDWLDVLESGLGLEVVARLGAGGRDYGSEVASRSVALLRDAASGVRAIVEKHSGGAGPPRQSELELLRDAVRAQGLRRLLARRIRVAHLTVPNPMPKTGDD